MLNKMIEELNDLGQSIWYDNIQRSLLADGTIASLIAQGVSGLTSNPTIFEKAITHSNDYDEDMQKLIASGADAGTIYAELVRADITQAADLLLPVYERTKGADGFVSVEVNPLLAHQTGRTVEQARSLFASLARPNVMIKVPATLAGLKAIERLIGEGIPVNVTLIFSIERYRQVAQAYLAGLERLVRKGKDLSRVASVASFFVSRVDTAVDAELIRIGTDEAGALRGRLGVANARRAYQAFVEIFTGPRFETYAVNGARVQRPLWASTGVKDPMVRETYYVDELQGDHTVNTLPPATLDAFMHCGLVEEGLVAYANEAASLMERLVAQGVDLTPIADRLERDGVASFSESHISLLDAIAAERARIRACG